MIIEELKKANQILEENLQKALARIAELEEEIRALKNKSSKNSSQPPSQDSKPNRPPTGNKGGAIKGHKANQRKLLPDKRVDQTEICRCSECPFCGGALKDYPTPSIFQFVELIEGRCLVTNYVQVRHRCSKCKKTFLAPLPEEVGGSPFGSNFHAMIGTFTGRYHISKRDAATLVKEIFSIPISNGVISSIEARLAKALESNYQEIQKEICSNEDPAHVDETTWRHRGQNGYLWEIATKNLTFYQIAFRRNREARDQLLGRDWTKPIVTDRLSVYHDLQTIHQYCLSHIFRNFENFAQKTGAVGVIGRALKKELNSVFKHWRLYQEEEISWRQLRQRCYYRRKNIQDLLRDGYFHQHEKFSRFCGQLLKDFDCLWTFLRVQGLEPTNNQAERDLRPMVLWRKRSYGTQGASGLRFVTIVGSVIQTLRKQGKQIIDFLGRVMKGESLSILSY